MVSIIRIVDTMTTRAGSGKRRTYSVDEKRRIVEETLKPGISVSVIARRHDINTNLVFTWRRRYQSAMPVPAMLPVEIAAPSRCETPRHGTLTARKGRIEIEFPSGHRLHVTGVVDAAMLRQVIEMLAR